MNGKEVLSNEVVGEHYFAGDGWGLHPWFICESGYGACCAHLLRGFGALHGLLLQWHS